MSAKASLKAMVRKTFSLASFSPLPGLCALYVNVPWPPASPGGPLGGVQGIAAPPGDH